MGIEGEGGEIGEGKAVGDAAQGGEVVYGEGYDQDLAPACGGSMV